MEFSAYYNNHVIASRRRSNPLGGSMGIATTATPSRDDVTIVIASRRRSNPLGGSMAQACKL